MNTLHKQFASKNLCTSADEDIREQMWHRLPRWLQPILTEVTGKAAKHETPSWRWTWWSRLGVSFFWLTAATWASGWLIHQGPLWWLLFPIPWIVATSIMQTFQTGFLHHASHGNLSGRRWFDQLIGEALSILILIRPLAVYQPKHKKHHGSLALEQDPDLAFIAQLGFKPGMPRKFYWDRLGRTLLSARFHGRWLARRMRANFVTASPKRRAAAIAYVIGLIGVGAVIGPWSLLFAWLLPATILLQSSLLLQLLTEHVWVRQLDSSAKTSIASVTHDRFFGDAPPQGKTAFGWMKWWLRLLLIHLPGRLLVAPGDLANHAWHHRYPLARTLWPNASFARRDDQISGHVGWPAYEETWGVQAMLNKTFDALSDLPRDATLGRPETYGK